MGWALITGGSRGIGLGIAEALAARKYHILIVARNADDLLKAKARIEVQFNVCVDTLSCDLTRASATTDIGSWLSENKYPVSILCNAAGMGGSTDFPDLKPEDLQAMIRLNFESAVMLCQLMIPLLKTSAPSHILNISSMAGFSPIPVKGAYAATKCALISFSYSLRIILKDQQISVSCLCPGPVFTKASIERETLKQLGWIGKQMSVKPEVVAETAVRAMLKSKMIIVPGRLAKFFSLLLRVIPKTIMSGIFNSFRRKK